MIPRYEIRNAKQTPKMQKLNDQEKQQAFLAIILFLGWSGVWLAAIVAASVLWGWLGTAAAFGTACGLTSLICTARLRANLKKQKAQP